jgi:hypothetical protein
VIALVGIERVKQPKDTSVEPKIARDLGRAAPAQAEIPAGRT